MRRTPIGACVLAASLVATLCGCAGVAAGPAIPAGNDWTTLPTSPPGAVRAAGSRPAIDAMPVSKVPARRGKLEATLGIQLYWNSTGSQANMEADANRIFDYIVRLGANSVAIDFFFFTDGEYPTHVYGIPGTTPSPAIMAMVVRNAREHGLRVLLRPLLNEKNIQIIRGAWRGSIEPQSVSSWFQSYYRFLKPYFIAAQVGKLDRSARQARLLRQARKPFRSRTCSRADPDRTEPHPPGLTGAEGYPRSIPRRTPRGKPNPLRH